MLQLPQRIRWCVCLQDCLLCIRRFYCLYGDSMNVAAWMSTNAKESGVCVSPQIVEHLASATDSRCHTSTDVSSEELKRVSMRASQTASDTGFRDLETLNSTLNTSLHHSLTETRDTIFRDGHSSDVSSHLISLMSRGLLLIYSNRIESSHQFLQVVRCVARIASDQREGTHGPLWCAASRLFWYASTRRVLDRYLIYCSCLPPC